MNCRDVLVVLLAAGCGSSSSSSSSSSSPRSPTPAAPAPALPTLLGAPVWDAPLDDPMAAELVRRVQAALDEPVPALEGTDPRMWRGPVQGWVERRVRLGHEIKADAAALREDSDPRMLLLAAVAVGLTLDDLANDIVALEMPVDATQPDDLALEARAAFRETLELQAYPVAIDARASLRECTSAASTMTEPLRAWEARCRQLDTDLGELVARVDARRNAQPSAQ